MILLGFVLESFGLIALTIAAWRSNAALVLTLFLLAVGYVLCVIPTSLSNEDVPERSTKSAAGYWSRPHSLPHEAGMALV